MLIVFFFKQKTAYELRISDWSSDVCSSDLRSEQAGVSQCMGAASILHGGHSLCAGPHSVISRVGDRSAAVSGSSPVGSGRFPDVSSCAVRASEKRVLEP